MILPEGFRDNGHAATSDDNRLAVLDLSVEGASWSSQISETIVRHMLSFATAGESKGKLLIMTTGDVSDHPLMLEEANHQ